MRPLYLEMTAFGSYAEKTALPFEELRHGLYLVTGDTGAGKTTIFDAIMFALFGVASGSDRTSDMLHCDYVPKSVDTAVKLRFSQNGKEYTVERRIHFSKVQGTKDQYRDGKPEALLTEPDAAPIEGAKKVTDRCEELLGLNAEQFSRIVMLAQGEFKKFLKANSDEKNEILGKLFDHSVYVYYQNLLLEARDALSRRRGAALGFPSRPPGAAREPQAADGRRSRRAGAADGGAGRGAQSSGRAQPPSGRGESHERAARGAGAGAAASGGVGGARRRDAAAQRTA